MSFAKNKSVVEANQKHDAGQTSGSEHEIEQRIRLLKGDVTVARSSLLDFFDPNSWIKKSNFEGIFNLMIFCLFLVLICLPLTNHSLYGRLIDPKFLYLVLRNAPGLLLKWLFLELYSGM